MARDLPFPPRPALATALLGVLCGILVACGGGGGGGGSSAGPTPVAPPATAQELDLALEVLDLVNMERDSRGLDPLDQDEDADLAAYAHAYDMEVRHFFDHVNPSHEGPGVRLSRAGVFWQWWGENIAAGQQSPQEVMTAWMNSSGHRANILDPTYGRLGVGVRIGPGGPRWVQDFVGP